MCFKTAHLYIQRWAYSQPFFTIHEIGTCLNFLKTMLSYFELLSRLESKGLTDDCASRSSHCCQFLRENPFLSLHLKGQNHYNFVLQLDLSGEFCLIRHHLVCFSSDRCLWPLMLWSLGSSWEVQSPGALLSPAEPVCLSSVPLNRHAQASQAPFCALDLVFQRSACASQLCVLLCALCIRMS